MGVDPTTQAIVGQALLAIAREMGSKLCRSAYSSIVREVKDASTGLLDRSGQSVAQSDILTPMLVGSLSHTFRWCRERYPVDTLTEGDFYIVNHPYMGGQHLPDIFIFIPIFFEDALVGFSASVAHHIDLGGGAAGINHAATDVYQEGLVLPPMKLNMSRDWDEGPFQDLIRSNVRLPELTIGDLNAQFAANRVGAARVCELCAKYGPEVVVDVMAGVIDYSERRIRAAIAAVPDGTYSGTAMVDDDGITDEPVPVQASVTVAGDRLEVDFSGTAPQVRRNLNAPIASTISGTLACLKLILTDADVPFNEGANKAITISVPPGSILNPNPPAPVRARMGAVYRAFDSVVMAMEEAVPQRVCACGFNTTFSFSLSLFDGDRYRLHQEVYYGGNGASVHGDGCDSVAAPLSNCTNAPVEALDSSFEFFRVEEYALRPDSGGIGEHRGGLGFRRSYRILKDEVRLAIYADRFRFPPPGMAGGGSAAPASCTVLRGTERLEVSSKGMTLLHRGDLVVVETGGGGGYGDPDRRAPEALERDRQQGYVS